MKEFNPQEVQLLNATSGHPYLDYRVCKPFIPIMEKFLKVLEIQGFTRLYTYGINFGANRKTRSGKGWSKHSNGIKWTDGSIGPRAIDIRKLLRPKDGKVLVVTKPKDRLIIIGVMEFCGMKVYHKKKGSVRPDHLHGEI